MNALASLARLYTEEIKALPRDRFALPGMVLLAAILLALALVVAPSPLGLWSFALLVYGAGPVLVGSWVALQVADLRASRFGHSLYTSPVHAGQVLTAHLLVGLTISVAYLVVTAPFLAVAAAHVDVPESVVRLALGSGLLMIFSVVLGVAMAVLLPARSVSAPVALTAGFLMLSMFAIPPAAVLQMEGGYEGSLLMQVLHVSPYVLVSDALGLLEASVGVEARDPARAGVVLGAEILALLTLAGWSYTREQGPEGWENRPSRRGVLAALAVIILLVVPLATAAPSYAPIDGHLPLGRGSQSYNQNATIVLVAPGEPLEAAPVGDHLAGTAKQPLDAEHANPRDLLIILPAKEGEAVAELQATLETDDRLVVEPSAVTLEHVVDMARLATGDGRGTSVLVLRVPVVLTPLHPQDLTSNFHPLWLNVTYRVEGDPDLREGAALAALRADVPNVLLQMSAAGAPLLLVTIAAAIHRRIRVGSTR